MSYGKFARENGYLDLLPLCCEMDHIVIEKRKAVLHREQTLATGGEMCDYWIVGDKTKKPVKRINNHVGRDIGKQ